MARRYIFVLCVFLFFSATSLVRAQEVPVYNFDTFRPLLEKKNDTVYILNFWATWCIPCRKEIPDFEQVSANYQNNKVKVILVSLDMPEKASTTLNPFLERFGVKSTVVLLDDVRSNYWINQVDPSWSGTIPATVIYKGVDRSFIPYPLTYHELDSIVKLKL